MLQNLTNFFNLIKTRKIKNTLKDSDLIAVGTVDSTWNGGYQPTAITYEDLAAQIGGGGGSILLTTSGISGPASLTGTTLNIPDYFVYTYEIGQYVPSQGGIIFHRYLDGTNENYLVVGINVASSSATWDNRVGPGQPPLLGCNSTWNGAANYAILNSATSTQFTSAAYLLQFWAVPTTGLFDWYLPSIDELSLVWQNRFNVNRTLSGNSSYGLIPGAAQIGTESCWSSTELSSSSAWGFSFYGGQPVLNSKGGSLSVRGVRKFSI